MNEIRAREVMYRLAEERGLLPQIKQLCIDARKEGEKTDTNTWTVNGLLSYLGKEIEKKEKIRYPKISEDTE